MEANQTWIPGPPPSRSGAYWVELSDQGGWPGIRLCVVSMRAHPKLSEQTLATFKAALRLKNITPEDFNQATLEAVYILDGDGPRIPEPLRDLWNCNAYLPIPKPAPRAP